MVLVIGLLTAVMVLVCLCLILLVLMQLPKKEAGAGLAFGGAATDALFGAGSGNFLTKATKYAATMFFVLAIILAVMQSHYSRRNISEFREQLGRPAPSEPVMPSETAPMAPVGAPPQPVTQPAPPITVPPAENVAVPAETNPAPQ